MACDSDNAIEALTDDGYRVQRKTEYSDHTKICGLS